MSGQMNSADVFGSNLSTMHPVSFTLPLKAARQSGSFLDRQSALHSGSNRGRAPDQWKCGMHELPQSPRAEHGPEQSKFSGDQQLQQRALPGLPQHDSDGDGNGSWHRAGSQPQRLGTVGSPLTARAQANNANPLAGWSTGIHALATNRVSPQVTPAINAGVSFRAAASVRSVSLGSYATVSRNGCSSCHALHNAPGQNSLLRGVDDQTCLICHNGSSNISPPVSNVLAEMVAPKYGHAFSAGNTPHRPHEAALLNQNMHVTCVDCHNPHSSNRVASFSAAPGVRSSQSMVTGISATDGVTVVSPAANQYENCLRCHGTSTGKKLSMNSGYLPMRVVSASDPLNVIPEFSSFATSSHPVFHDRTSMFPQPSLRPA